MTGLLPVEIAVRLADEGVPLRAIARATHVSSDQLREQFREAREQGTLYELPKEDWPPGFPRDKRALELSRMVDANRQAVTLAVQQVFHLTATEVTLLMLLLTNQAVAKERIDMAVKTVDVHICRIRASLAGFGIAIETLWGFGYQLPPAARTRLMKLIVRRVRRAVPA